MKTKNSITNLCLVDITDTQFQLVMTPEEHVKVDRMSLSAIPFQKKSTAIRLSLLTLLGCTVVSALLLFTTLPVAAREIYVPFVVTDHTPGSEEEISGSGNEEHTCILNAEEAAVAQLMLADSGQKRDHPVCDPILSQVARARASDMALRGYFSHTDPDGNGPNILARNAGYKLPDWYSSKQDSNNIESIAAGYTSSAAVWEGWIKSPKHVVHVLGTEAFYGEQDSYGIGYYFDPNSPAQHYWVFLSAPTPE